jgi:hypothetical protein
MIQLHPSVSHPVHLRVKRHREGMGAVAKINDWLATHLAMIFGAVWTVWAFFISPLAVQMLPAVIQAKFSYYSQSWVQLFALPLFVYVGNKLQRSSDAQSEVLHQALTHIATVSDQNKQLLEQNTELTKQVHALAVAAQVSGGAGSNPASQGLPADKRVVPPPAASGRAPLGGDRM